MKPRTTAILVATLFAAAIAAPGSAAAQAGSAGVTVTLVRWPYT